MKLTFSIYIYGAHASQCDCTLSTWSFNCGATLAGPCECWFISISKTVGELHKPCHM